MSAIDFVIAWVDEQDPLWQKEYDKYKGSESEHSAARFRDWGILRYWFRSVEKYADWVRNIYFVTWGHIPDWLDTTNPKLKIVRHEDYIPRDYLPTFNANTIELNIHRIEGLSEQFVYFNDDTFLCDRVEEDFFFKDGLPRDCFMMNGICFKKDSIGWIVGSDIAIINNHFDMKTVIRKNHRKIYSPVNGIKTNLKTFLLSHMMPWFMGIEYWHLPNAFLKQTYIDLWNTESELLDETCRHKFRYKLNVNQYLMKYWQLVKGEFIPRSPRAGKCVNVNDSNTEQLKRTLTDKRFKMICVNDTAGLTHVEQVAEIFSNYFSKKLPEKSSFEK